MGFFRRLAYFFEGVDESYEEHRRQQTVEDAEDALVASAYMVDAWKALKAVVMRKQAKVGEGSIFMEADPSLLEHYEDLEDKIDSEIRLATKVEAQEKKIFDKYLEEVGKED
jgi:hypothetical protein